MKKQLRNILIVLFTYSLLAVSMSVHADSDNEEIYLKNYESTLSVMKKEMEAAPKTGDPTLDFLYEMIPHHEAAVSMAENLLSYGENLEVKKLAMTIMRDQIEGIQKMKTLLDQIKNNPQVDKAKETAYLKIYNEDYKQMMEKMSKVEPTGSVDKDFLEEMIPHDEGAVKMATNILNYTTNEDLRGIATHIISGQQRQLEEMKQLLKTVK